MESLLSAVVCDNLTGERHNSNRELIGQGFANLLCSAVGALPSAGSIPRSAQNYRAGGRTALSGVVCGVLVLLMFSVLSPVIGMVPLAVIAGLLMSVALDLFDDWTKNLIGKLRTHRSQRKEVLIDLSVVALVAVTTVSINIVAAVGVGVAIASILFMARMGKSVVRRTYTGDNMHSRKMRSRREMETLVQQGSSITVYELQGPIFFGSADRLTAVIEQTTEQIGYVILDLQRVTDIDSTGAKILARLAKQLRTSDHYLLVSSINEDQPLWEFLEVMDVVKEIGNHFFFYDTDCALEWAEDHLLNSIVSTSGFDDVALANMDIMNDMDDDELNLLQQLLKREFWHQEQAVFREGNLETDLYIVLKGSVSIKKQLPDGVESKRLVTFGPGGVFGEMALIDKSPRSADAWADNDCELLRLPHAAFVKLCREHPQVANKLLTNIAKEISFKLRRTSASLASLEST
jgi:SulP family sulfate permease